MKMVSQYIILERKSLIRNRSHSLKNEIYKHMTTLDEHKNINMKNLMML